MTRVVGIAGGTASGKTTVARALAKALGERACTIVHDRYYKPLAIGADPAAQNFDHPDALDTAAMVADVDRLRSGQAVELPRYDFTRHAREVATDHVEPHEWLILEGILIFNDAGLRQRCDLRVFVHTADDIRLARRIRRDIAERGRGWQDVLEQYETTVKPMHDQFVAPTEEYADLVLDGTVPIVDNVTTILRAMDAAE